MIELFKIILSLSLSGTILILLLFVCHPLYQNRLSKQWQYYVWLLVIARLLLPITLKPNLMGNLFRQAERRMEQSGNYSSAYINTGDNINSESDISSAASREEQASDTTDSHISLPDMTDEGSTDIGSQTDTSRNPALTESKQSNKRLKDMPQILFMLWLIVALLLSVRKITIYQSFVKYVTAGSKPVDDISLLERFGQIITQNQIKRTIDLCTDSLVSSPLLIGFRHVRIVLPTTDLSEDDFYYTILHELTHYKRRDMFYKWLVQLTICLHWFNPFIYLMGHEINRLCELSCDERVIRTLSDKSRKSYGDTLINAVSTSGTYKDTLASVTLNESRELLKGRLDAIMKYKKIPRKVQTIAIFITGLLIGGAAILGAYAAPTAGTSSNSDANADNNAPFATKLTDHINDSTAQDSDSVRQNLDYRIEYEYGTYYILTADATEADKPISNVTNGYCHLVLVHRDEYRTFGSWRDSEMPNLVHHLMSQCRTLLENKEITQEDVDIIIAAATEIQETYRSQNDDSADFEDNDLDFSEQIENSLPEADVFEYLSDYLEEMGILEEYNENDIITIKNSYYYQNARVRLLIDVRSDGSFENSNYDGRGSVDLKLLRDENNKIVRIEYLSAEEAAKIIQDMDIFPSANNKDKSFSILDLNLITKHDLSDDLLNLLDSCDSGKWYVIAAAERQYIYYNGLPHTYAYEPHINGSETGDLITVAIMDMKTDSPLFRRRESLSNYVLLSFSYTPDAEYKLAITYNRAPVTYESVTIE